MRMKRALSMLLALLTLTGTACAESDGLTLFAVNVGKADALLLSAGKETYLIDTGTAESWGKLSCALKMLGVETLTGVILTHTHGDHAGGAWSLATSSIPVEGWYASAYYEGVKEKKHPAVLAAELRGQDVTWLKGGDTLPLGDGLLTVLGPIQPDEKENNNSLVLLAEGGGGRMLLTGDMEFPEETSLLNAGVIPDCDVLKVGNHGNRDATSEPLVRQVRPRVAIVSTDSAVEPDTPAPRVLQALLKFGADIYLTQQAEAGVLVTLRDGRVQAQTTDYAALPAPAAGVMLSAPNLDNDEITLRNESGEPIDLTGWYLHSERGGEQFVLPEGTVLVPGESLTVTTLSSDEPGDLLWPEKKVWHKSKEDKARLYDAYGRLMAEK